jgi:hypothetical protein
MDVPYGDSRRDALVRRACVDIMSIATNMTATAVSKNQSSMIPFNIVAPLSRQLTSSRSPRTRIAGVRHGIAPRAAGGWAA